MITVRAVFEKRGRAKYISHLDLMRCMQRAFRRADVPIYYTEGFNPHAYLMFPLALSLGFESRCECMDFRLEGDFSMQTAMDRLNAVLPSDLQILSVASPIHKHTEIANADYAITLYCEKGSVEMLQKAWEDFFCQPEIFVEKKTKRGVSRMNLKEYTTLLSAEALPDGLKLRLRMPAGTALNLNPCLLTNAWIQCLPKGMVQMFHAERLAILCADGSAFL